MKFVVLGAGAIGSAVGGRLFESGHRVTLVARGRQFRTLIDNGLTLQKPEGSMRLDIPVVDHPGRVDLADGAAVLLCVKSQDTADALQMLASIAPTETPVVCLQNAVANERMALRKFANVYGVPVMCPATYLVPGVVQVHSTPITGILDIGRYPTGGDEFCGTVARAFAESGFVSEVRDDIMRWKYRKLIMNLRNAVEAACGRAARSGRAAGLAVAEGEKVLAAADIDVASSEEDRLRRGTLLQLRPIDGQERGGGSVWQSLTRGAGVETDFLNGEIVLMGRLHGVPTPVNQVLQRVIRQMASEGRGPGTMSETDLLAMLANQPS